MFETPSSTVIYSKEGKLLGARIADDGQWRFPKKDTVPYKFAQAILHFEDRGFYDHYGFSPKAIVRAMVQNIKERRIVSGASTITMQVIRLSEQGKSRSFFRKFLEVIKATRLETRYSKYEILALYASNAPMGGNVVGLEAASWCYFSRPPSQLSWAESALLAVLPNAPSLMHLAKNREELLNKRNRLLKTLYEYAVMTKEDYLLALEEHIPKAPKPLPQLDGRLLDRSIKEGLKGQQITSSIDYTLQTSVLDVVEHHRKQLAKNEIHNISVVVIDVETGNILAYVGNTIEEGNEHNNYVDVASSARSTGSILKPLLYAGMLNAGKLTPNTLVKDVPYFSSGYAPENYDKRYRGAVPAYEALARSLNVPAVQMLSTYGVPKFKYQLEQMGFSTFNKPPEHYGLTLVLGGGEARLDELTSAYAFMANTLHQYALGSEEEFSVGFYKKKHRSTFNYSLSASSVWYTFEALLKVARPDEENNWQTFSTSQKIAWKTGTSFGFKDAWSVGVTPKYAVGVWVGNADGEGRPGLVGIEAAAPILFHVFDVLPKSEWFSFPYDDVEKAALCSKSGYLASAFCAQTDSLLLPKSSLNTAPCPYHQRIHLNEKGEQVNIQCHKQGKITSENWFVLPPVMEKYYKMSHPDYKSLPKYSSYCKEDVSDNKIAVIYPKNGQKIYLPKNFEGTKMKFVLEATSNTKSSLFWHINDAYLGETNNVHTIECVLEEGVYQLQLLDEKGNQAIVSFDVIGK